MSINKNLPNYLTIIRIISIPLIILTFYLPNSSLVRQFGAVLFILASLTDFFDGYLARKFNLISSFGQMLDPIADKLLVGCVIVMLVKQNMAQVLPCLLILAREFFIAGLREFLGQIQVSVPVSRLAKIKTVIQITAIALLILGNEGSGFNFVEIIGQIGLWIAAIITVITGYHYFDAARKHF